MEFEVRKSTKCDPIDINHFYINGLTFQIKMGFEVRKSAKSDSIDINHFYINGLTFQIKWDLKLGNLQSVAQ